MLIGLNGRKQAGKDTVHERIVKLMADVVEVERVSFADLLYASAAAIFDVPRAVLDAAKDDPEARVTLEACGGVHDMTVRTYLQRYGTEAHRDVFGTDFWVDQVAAQLNLHKAGRRIVVVTDVRFENEAMAVHHAGGAVVEVIGPEGRVTDDAHASEAALPEELIDVTLTNTVRDDGFRALDAQVSTLLRLHLGAQSYSIRVPSC